MGNREPGWLMRDCCFFAVVVVMLRSIRKWLTAPDLEGLTATLTATFISQFA